MEQDDTEEMNLAVLCRLCATHSERMVGIYSDEGLGTELATKVNLHLPVKVSEADVLPLQCCEICTSTVLTWHNLVSSCVEAEQRLKDLLSEKTEKDNTYVDMEPDTEPDQPDIMEDTMEEDVEVPETINITQESVNSEIIPATPELNPELNSVETFTCNLCLKIFPTQADLSKHARKHRAAVNTIKPKKTRRQGGLKARSENELNIPINPDDTILIIEQDPNTDDIKLDADVEEPQFDVDESKLLKKKQRKEKPTHFECGVCKKLSSDSYKHKMHVRTHTELLEHYCHVCGKGFRMAGYLRKHLRFSHEEVKNFRCGLCTACFTSRPRLEEHINRHTDNRPFVCDICGKAFRQKGGLRIHKLYHFEVFKYECDTCDKKFRRATELKNHARVHSGDKPHECVLCTDTFRIRAYLNRHMKVVHGEAVTFIA